jgi:CheY-like chemotaxis protein
LVELHGGTITATSPGEGLGATFTINLPIHAAAQNAPIETATPAAGTAQTAAARADLRDLRALVVDDEADSLEMLTKLLTGHGMEVRACNSAAAALAELSRFKPDVLISDIGLPETDGYDLIRQVRALPPEQGGQVPAIALTAYAGTPDRVRAFSAGYQAHVAKPVEPLELTLVIATLTNRLDRSA